MNIIKKIDNWGTTSPNKIAYDYLGTTNTYADLKNYSDKLATYLNQLNLDTKNPIMVFGGQDFNMIATFLGIVKAGYAYIPVDTHSPVERLNVINDIAKPAACIAVEELPEGFNGLESLPIVDQAKLEDIFSNGDVVINEEKYVSGDDNFYIIFTSGTTGVPKGVQISHDNLLSFLGWMEKDFGIKEDVNCISQPPYSFDLSVMDLYPTLTRGGKLSVLPKETTDNFKELFATLPKLHANEWVSTPSFMDLCLLNPAFNEENLPELTHFLFCGEELTHQTAQNLHTRFPNGHIFNTYGPTETTVAVTQVEITEQVLNDYPRLPIGITKDDTKIVLLDDNLKEVAAGEAGEIVILGPSVSKGYINNPEKTQAAFIDFQGQKAYRTGDLGQFDENGQLLYKGRIDFQVKLHGFRIELEDVDHHLDRVSLVSQATTVPKYDKNHKVQQLIAYVVAKKNDFEDEFKLTQAIKKELSETMMSYMMPQRFIYVDSLPLTNNGKIDRKSLMKEVNK